MPVRWPRGQNEPDGAWWVRPIQLLQGISLIVAVGLVIQAPIGETQPLTAELDLARREPIIDGTGAAGIQLGDTVEAVIKRLGGLPWKTEEFEGGARRDFFYVGVDPQAQWTLGLGITFRQNRVQAIHIFGGRRPPGAYPYQGRTSRGYQVGDPPDRLRALYGAPDETLRHGLQEFWWYRAAGLLISPGERAVRGEMEASLIVINPQASPAEVRRLLHLP